MAVKVSLKTAKQEVKQKIMPAFSVGVLFKGIGKQLKDVDHATGFARSEDIPGAHAKHYNAHSIGVCYEGGLDEKGHPADTRTKAQKFTLLALLTSLKADYPEAKILGHRDLPWVKKECPCFNAQVEYKDL
ncbi:MAG: N-acetylmuramoyl-L-alanine amidase [Prevotella sp.]|nr:N-acetylmuramoyl-L-alanine amidase [Prevotella sp.]